MDSKICPRCGGEISYIERHRHGGRVYVVACHYTGYSRDGGGVRKKVRKCYLGPIDEYIYVSATHRDLGLTFEGASNPDRAIQYLDSLIDALGRAELDKSLLVKVIERLRRLTGILEARVGDVKS